MLIQGHRIEKVMMTSGAVSYIWAMRSRKERGIVEDIKVESSCSNLALITPGSYG